MTSLRHIGKKSQGVEDFSSLSTHPYNIMLILLLTALTMAFVAISGAYLFSRITTAEAPIKIPILFVINTLALIASGYMLKKAKRSYENDDTEGYQKALLLTFLLTLLFMGLQFLGWSELLANNPNLAKGNMRAYVYALSILHFIHILGGLPFMLLFLLTAYRRMKEPVSVMVYFSDPLKRLKLKMLGMYWSFLEKLWIYIILFFWVNYFIS